MLKRNKIIILGAVLVISGIFSIITGQLFFEETKLFADSSLTMSHDEFDQRVFYIPAGRNVFISILTDDISFINFSVHISQNQESDELLIDYDDRVTSYFTSFTTSKSDFYYFILKNDGGPITINEYVAFYNSESEHFILILLGGMLLISGLITLLLLLTNKSFFVH